MTASGGRTRPKSKKRRSLKSGNWPRSAGWIAAAAILVLIVLWWVLRAEGPSQPSVTDGLETRLRTMAAERGVTSDNLEIDTGIRKVEGVFIRTWKIRFPNSASREEFIAEAAILGDQKDTTVAAPVSNVGDMISLRIDHGIESFDLELEISRQRQTYTRPESIESPTRPQPTATPRPVPPPGRRGRLAILLDDGGQKMDLVATAGKLPPEVGVAILPFLPSSAETAFSMHEAGHEVWLHLPMEAVGDSDPGPGALMVDMTDEQLRDAVFMAINNIPHVVGINNHMGSKATANLRMMTWMMQDLAAMGLAFLDSRTTVDTVAEEAARVQGVKTGRRHVFLDNERTEAAIREQLEEAVYRARMEGEIIAIGHLNEVTVAVLASELPDLEKRGVDLARPTELLN